MAEENLRNIVETKGPFFRVTLKREDSFLEDTRYLTRDQIEELRSSSYDIKY